MIVFNGFLLKNIKILRFAICLKQKEPLHLEKINH